MSELVPNRLLFRFEVPIRYRRPPVIDGDLSDWPDEYLLPDFGRLDGRESFARVWLAWHESGLFLACRIEGRRSPFQCDPTAFWKGDNLRLMTDMRDTRDLKRASRYCQQFYFLPTGGGRDRKQPVAGAARINRATEHAPPVRDGLIAIAATRQAASALDAGVERAGRRGGRPLPADAERLASADERRPSPISSKERLPADVYTLEAHIPQTALSGFDPIEHSRIGLYVMVEDRDLGQQYLTVGDELNWHVDPSTWATGVLTPMPR
ncbi:MAG: hypothetical protein GXY55_10610 [Phycisphaerae bacterium]|nr:hypothetical protein [Phycisphaerae bacterium]